MTKKDSVYLLVLACSVRQGGFCVAGKTMNYCAGVGWSDGGEWIRPVASANPQQAALPLSQVICSNDRKVQLGDIVQVHLAESAAIEGQPENRLLVPERWNFICQAPSSWVASVVDKPRLLWMSEPDYFGLAGSAVSSQVVESGAIDQSLYLVRPERLQFELTHTMDRRSGDIRKRVKASFLYAGHLHTGLSVTCPEFNMAMRPYFPALGAKPVIAKAQNDSDLLLCLSLGSAFEATQRHHKLVAGVIGLQGVDEPVRLDIGGRTYAER